MADKKAYQEWKTKAEQVRQISSDKKLARWQKAHLAGKALMGIDLNGLQSKHRRKFLNTISQINRILANYQLDSFDDYQKISEDELSEIIRLLKALTPP
ncbi:IS66 family transposase OrfD [Oleiphilus messinensis]|uniref:IS66 family transposase OrfD n=1 Tax=Oleiphilus messinensis TaxID=141451 RepID=A0A1Y0IB52_9GAMM|nr:hypothetical protein [Oleiphilus messinensis]ARU57701.1 IS66 family transposase OrfD [Oleiphilus messinensis]